MTFRTLSSGATGVVASSQPRSDTEAVIPVLVAGIAIFLVGLALSFAGDRLRPRIAGLGAMATGAVVVLVAADPAAPATWLLAAPAAVTFAGMIWFASRLERWARTASAPPPTLDDPG